MVCESCASDNRRDGVCSTCGENLGSLRKSRFMSAKLQRDLRAKPKNVHFGLANYSRFFYIILGCQVVGTFLACCCVVFLMWVVYVLLGHFGVI